METTNFAGLHYVPADEESTTKVKDFRRGVSNNFVVIDTVLDGLNYLATNNQSDIKALGDEVSGLRKELNEYKIYTCSAEETTKLEDGTNVPNIKTPNADLVYLVSSGDAAPNMWLEYIWVGHWEQWGSATVDLTGYIKKDQGKDNAGSTFYVDFKGDVSKSDKFARDFWVNKRAIFFGTSITDYCRKSGANKTFGERGYTYLLTKALDMTPHKDADNFGVAGAITISPSSTHSLYDHVVDYGSIYGEIISHKSKIEQADVVFIETATNDFKKDVDLGEYTSGTSYDLETFYGALQGSIAKIRAYNPKALIVLLADTKRAGFTENGKYKYYSDYTNGAECTLNSYVAAMEDIAINMGVMFCNWYEYSGIDESNISHYTWDGQLHLDEDGYEQVADLTKRTLLEYSAVYGLKDRLDDFETKIDDVSSRMDDMSVPTKLSDLENDVNYIASETDPTVPAWAKANTKPTYTCEEIGAAPADHTHGNATDGRKVVFGTYVGNADPADGEESAQTLRSINIGATPSFVWVGMGNTLVPWYFDEYRTGTSGGRAHERDVVYSGYAFTGTPLYAPHNYFEDQDEDEWPDRSDSEQIVLCVQQDGFQVRNTSYVVEYADNSDESCDCVLNLKDMTYFYFAII